MKLDKSILAEISQQGEAKLKALTDEYGGLIWAGIEKDVVEDILTSSAVANGEKYFSDGDLSMAIGRALCAALEDADYPFRAKEENSEEGSTFDMDAALDDITTYLHSQEEQYFIERGTTSTSVLSNNELLHDLASEHHRCVTRYGADRAWSCKDACDSAPGISAETDCDSVEEADAEWPEEESGEEPFDKEGFLSHLHEQFPELMGSHFCHDMVENLVNHAVAQKMGTKDAICYFLSDMLPEVEFGEVAHFTSKLLLTSSHGLPARKAWEEEHGDELKEAW